MIYRLRMSSLASSTTKAYAVGLKDFDQLGLNQQLSIILTPPLNNIFMLMAHLSIPGFKQTDRAYMFATAFKCKELGNGDPTAYFLVGKVLDSMKRQINNKDDRMSVTLDIFKQIFHSLFG